MSEAKKIEAVVVATARIEITDQQLAALPSVSARIRFMLTNEYTRSEVAKRLNIRYQHVRNVELTPLKKVS